MREPYRTWFEGYEDHWLIGQYLQGDEPWWAGLAGDARLECLSRGEKVLVDFAAAFANVIAWLDDGHQYRIELGLRRVLGADL